jgi:hypothetical protein
MTAGFRDFTPSGGLMTVLLPEGNEVSPVQRRSHYTKPSIAETGRKAHPSPYRENVEKCQSLPFFGHRSVYMHTGGECRGKPLEVKKSTTTEVNSSLSFTVSSGVKPPFYSIIRMAARPPFLPVKADAFTPFMIKYKFSGLKNQCE